MPLTVAMALSGLEADQWNGDIKHLYNQGALALSSYAARSRSSSITSSGFSSCESGISSISPRSDIPHNIQNLHSIYLELFSKLEKLMGTNNTKDVPIVSIICETV